MTFSPHNIYFPEVRLEYFLKQEASNIFSILTLPPSTPTPSLSVGDHIRNALVTLATQLNRIGTISIQTPKDITSSPRLETPILYNNSLHPAAVPRVKKTPASSSTNTPVTALQIHSKESKNTRFDNRNEHRYPLRSKNRNTKYNSNTATNKTGTNFKNLASRLLLA